MGLNTNVKSLILWVVYSSQNFRKNETAFKITAFGLQGLSDNEIFYNNSQWDQVCVFFCLVLFLSSFLNSCGCSAANSKTPAHDTFFYPLNGAEHGSQPECIEYRKVDFLRSVDEEELGWAGGLFFKLIGFKTCISTTRTI